MALLPSTKTTLGAAAIVAGAFLSGALWIERSLASAREAQAAVMVPVVKSQDEMRNSLSMIEFRLRLIEATGTLAVPMPTFRAWVADFKERNPTISVPAVQ